MKRLLLRDGKNVPLAPKALDTLVLLVERRGEVFEKDELMKALWPDSFVEEANLTVNISVLRKALGERLHQHRYIVTVPGRGYRFVASVREFPEKGAELLVERTQARIVIAEEEALCEEETDFPLASSVEPLQLTGRRRARRSIALVSTCAALVLTAGALLLYRYATSERAQPAPIRSVAVLPLKNLTADPTNEYFSDGLTDGLITALSKIPDLKVISRGSVFRFKDREIDPREVGRQLGVATVLEGSVRKSSGSVRVAVRLVSVGDGRVLWTRDTAEHSLDDIFGLQDEIARSIAAGLRVQLSGATEQQLSRHHTSDVEAYNLYLKGRFFWNKRTEEGLRKSIEYFDQALARDPNYALAQVGLADSYSLVNLYSAQQQTDAFPNARAAAERALQLDDSLAEAHTALAYVKEQYDWDWSGAEREFKRALELDPNYATAHQYYSEFLAFQGETEKGLRHIRRAHELDPLSLIINTGLGYPYLCARRCDEALREFQKALEIDRNFPLAIYYTARCHEQQNRFEEAIAEYRKAIALSGGSSLMTAKLGYTYAVSGRKKEARALLNELQQRSKERYISPFLIAGIYAGLGEKDEALAWLEKAYKERDGLLVLLNVDSQLDPLRSDSRFTDLLRRVGFARTLNS